MSWLYLSVGDRLAWWFALSVQVVPVWSLNVLPKSPRAVNALVCEAQGLTVGRVSAAFWLVHAETDLCHTVNLNRSLKKYAGSDVQRNHSEPE